MRNIFTLIVIVSVFHQNFSQIWNVVNSFGAVRRMAINLGIDLKIDKEIPSSRSEKLQVAVSRKDQFPCNLTNSKSLSKPRTVHELRPGDIDVIAAIGDSLTAGIGITSTELKEMLSEERGKSFSIGGERDWREYTTLPNILKVFNPDLVGYSLNTSLSRQEGSQLNVAEKSMTSADTIAMAKKLVRKIKSDKRINVVESWKMVTIFIGANDLCGKICKYRCPLSSLRKHRNDLHRVLRILRDNLPRTFVNIIPAPNLRPLVELKAESPICEVTRRLECPCLFASQYKTKKKLLYKLMRQWQKIDLELGDLNEFNRDDFAVVTQPFTVNYTFPVKAPGIADPEYFAPDCFHFSQKMHARAANDLWNNIMEPVGNKSLDGHNLFEKFNCPTEKNPYIYTKRNSRIK